MLQLHPVGTWATIRSQLLSNLIVTRDYLRRHHGLEDKSIAWGHRSAPRANASAEIDDLPPRQTEKVEVEMSSDGDSRFAIVDYEVFELLACSDWRPANLEVAGDAQLAVLVHDDDCKAAMQDGRPVGPVAI
jgi:hypothetical protein